LPGDKASSGLVDDDPRVAAAALLIHVMAADGVCSDEERARLKEALSRAYDVSGTELKTLLRAAEEAEADAVDLYSFTSVLKRHLVAKALTDFIHLMLKVVFTDGEMHELAYNAVQRCAVLFDV